MFEVDLPKEGSNHIKIIGVGGGGSNAADYIYKKGVKDVDFVVCNTDLQHLNSRSIPIKIQLGEKISEGLGAGTNPEIGEKAALESIDSIREIFTERTKMVFITAGMGGGTGTGAAPVVAQVAKEKGMLSVGVITTPFDFEGTEKINYAMEGLAKLEDALDTLIVINNEKIMQLYPDLKKTDAYNKSNEILYNAVRGIAEIITKDYEENIDLNDIKKVLKNSGKSIIGIGFGKGKNRAIDSVKDALNSPLLEINNIKGAKNIILLFTYSKAGEITISENKKIMDYVIQESKNKDTFFKVGSGFSEDLADDEISITFVATGFFEKTTLEDNNKYLKTTDTGAIEINFDIEQDLKDKIIIHKLNIKDFKNFSTSKDILTKEEFKNKNYKIINI